MPAPTESAALAALDKVQKLTGPQLETALNESVGAPMLGIFRALAKKLSPNADDAALGPVVHCMVLAYLLRQETAA